jgi:signal transduction histidine kinase/ActR/RegA family two-component response regulator
MAQDTPEDRRSRAEAERGRPRALAAADEPLGVAIAQALGPAWAVERVTDARIALRSAAELPDLLIVAADESGCAAVQALRARDPDIPALAVGTPPARARDLAGEPDEYLSAADLPLRAAFHLERARERQAALGQERAGREKAEVAARAKDEFIAMISHELRTPLGAILIWAQLLKTEEVDPPTMERAVGMIERSTRTLTQLIDDLLDASRIIAGKLTFEKRPVELGPVVEAACEGAQPLAQAKAVVLERHVEPSLAPVSGDPTRLQQVVANLIANAIKFTPEGGRVQVLLERAGNSARVQVSDTGAGIGSEFLPFLFERFQQADTTTTRKQKGLGLGLAIARHIVELHGGTIEATSPGRGQGSTFRVTLPLLAREPASERRPEDAATQTSLRGIRVLVVDDEEDAREATAVLLAQAGARVVSVGSAAEAVSALHADLPDVLLSDIAMPGEDGYALIRRIRSLPQGSGGRIPAAALTAYATLEDRAQALRAGYDEHIPKPVDPIRLVGAVAMLAAEARRA